MISGEVGGSESSGLSQLPGIDELEAEALSLPATG